VFAHAKLLQSEVTTNQSVVDAFQTKMELDEHTTHKPDSLFDMLYDQEGQRRSNALQKIVLKDFNLLESEHKPCTVDCGLGDELKQLRINK